mmetsp:Transcript_16685/g.42406  ORF Transcript_16685/g.42406 Transcript_16685/m.42406 type:complete len:209 (+) Transcript_16685:252-878(+)
MRWQQLSVEATNSTTPSTWPTTTPSSTPCRTPTTSPSSRSSCGRSTRRSGGFLPARAPRPRRSGGGATAEEVVANEVIRASAKTVSGSENGSGNANGSVAVRRRRGTGSGPRRRSENESGTSERVGIVGGIAGRIVRTPATGIAAEPATAPARPPAIDPPDPHRTAGISGGTGGISARRCPPRRASRPSILWGRLRLWGRSMADSSEQ